MLVNDGLMQLPLAPRTARRKDWTSGCALWFVRLFILPHTLVGIFLLLSVPSHWFVAHFGTPVTAVVDGRDTTLTRKGRALYKVYYHYMLNNRRYPENKSVGQEKYEQTHVGDRFAGRASALVGHALFVDSDRHSDGTLGMAFALFWSGIVSIFVYGAWVAPLRQRWLVMIGQPAIGTVTGRREKKGKGTTYTVLYAFTAPGGMAYSGKWNVSNLDYQRAVEGSEVTVLYHPRNPRRNLPYEYCDFVAGSR